jgi:energy-coupling factor transporter ATP-binding protein EcfA2
MSSLLIIGESGSGKSTSLRNLDPEKTFIINAFNKPLPFRGGIKKFDTHLFFTDKVTTILDIIHKIDTSKPEIKVIVIDDFQAVMTNEFMRSSFERGYDKFTRIGKGVWDIIMRANATRSDLVVVLLAHSETDESGKIGCKVVGKLVKEKVPIEGMCTIVLYAFADKGRYLFQTQNNGTSIAKTPMDMFSTETIENDLNIILDAIKNYYPEDDLPKIIAPKELPNDIELLICKITTQEELTQVCTQLAQDRPDLKELLKVLYLKRKKQISEESTLSTKEDVSQ